MCLRPPSPCLRDMFPPADPGPRRCTTGSGPPWDCPAWPRVRGAVLLLGPVLVVLLLTGGHPGSIVSYIRTRPLAARMPPLAAPHGAPGLHAYAAHPGTALTAPHAAPDVAEAPPAEGPSGAALGGLSGQGLLGVLGVAGLWALYVVKALQPGAGEAPPAAPVALATASGTVQDTSPGGDPRCVCRLGGGCPLLGEGVGGGWGLCHRGSVLVPTGTSGCTPRFEGGLP